MKRVIAYEILIDLLLRQLNNSYKSLNVRRKEK